LNNNSELITVEYISNYFLYEGKPAILSIIHDISSEIQVKQLKQDVEKNVELLTETKEFNNSIIELFANISHELKTPLNVIFSAIQVLDIYKNDTEKLENKIDEYLVLIRQNCYRLMRLINNFLDITKVDSGFLKLNIGNYNIVKVVEDITLSVASYANSKNLELTFDTDVEEKFIGFDPDKIERIMLNLLSNSVKYSKSTGEILVTLLDQGDTISISVKDTGLGIPADKGKLIFERFGQVDKTLKRVSEGSGIGLSLVKSFVEMHNGSIELKSELGKGSEFIITLPSTLLGQHREDKNTILDTNSERINIEFSDIYTDI
jgi:signal transduction histidine kinase